MAEKRKIRWKRQERIAEGRSITEAVEIAQGLTRKIVESYIEHGDPPPPALRKLR